MDNYSSDPMTVLDKKSEYCKVITINPVGNMNMCTKCHPVVKEKKHKYVSLMVVIQKKNRVSPTTVLFILWGPGMAAKKFNAMHSTFIFQSGCR